MIALATDYLVFQMATGESAPFSADAISEELVGDSEGTYDPELVGHAANAVFHYFKHELGYQTVTLGEFAAALEKVLDELKRENRTFEDEGKTEDELKAEYRKIAERRVRLGLVLGKLGEQNGISVANDEVQRAIMGRARQFPGQEQQVFQFYASNPQAQAEIRAPLFEDKVVDFIAELATVNDRKVDRETLFADPEDEPKAEEAKA